MSLNRFDSLGNVLASSMGQHVLLWEPKFRDAGSRASKIPDEPDNFFKDTGTRRKRPRNNDDDDEPKKKKQPSKKQKS